MQNGKEALRLFGEKIGMPNLKLNAEQLCELTVGDGLEIFFEGTSRDSELRLNGRVGHLHNSDGEVLHSLLVANYNGQATGPSALSIDPMSGEVILGRGIDVEALTAAQFVEAVESFLKYLSFWTAHLPTLTPAASQPTPTSDEGLFIRI